MVSLLAFSKTSYLNIYLFVYKIKMFYSKWVWWSLCLICFPDFSLGWKEREEGSRREGQRREGSGADKWPPPGERHGKHDAVWSGEVGQECNAGLHTFILKTSFIYEPVVFKLVVCIWKTVPSAFNWFFCNFLTHAFILFSYSLSLMTGLSLTNMTEMLRY